MKQDHQRILIPTVQEVCAEFNTKNGEQIKLSVRRLKNNKSCFLIERNKHVIKEGSLKSVNLPRCFDEISRKNGYISLCYYTMAWSTYEFAKAHVDIRLHPSGDGSWEVRIRYNNGKTVPKQYSSNMAQGDVMNTLMQELGIPNRNK